MYSACNFVPDQPISAPMPSPLTIHLITLRWRHLFRCPWLIAIALLSTAQAPADAEILQGYAVGNSLTWNTLLAGGYDNVTSLGAGDDNRSTTDYHIKCGSSLTSILASPSTVCVSPTDVGTFQDGLRTDLDTLFLQPFYGSTLRQEIESFETLVDTARQNSGNANTRVFLFATWAARSDDSDLLSHWNGHTA